MLEQYFMDTFAHKRVCLLGFGREGKSTFKALRKYVPQSVIIIADKNPEVSLQFKEEFGTDSHVCFFGGENYTEALNHCDIIIKSPGVSHGNILKAGTDPKVAFTSQTTLFLELFRNQVVGVTGTKGKSTTVSLLHRIFTDSGKEVLLVGNIGTPPFEILDRVTSDTIVIYEMSSHQLENSAVSPSTAILLNIFQEHLDHYDSYRDYQLAKLNIARWQRPGDAFICNTSLEVISGLLAEIHCPGTLYTLNEKVAPKPGVWCEGPDLKILDAHSRLFTLGHLCTHRKLPGQHNLYNIAAASLAAHLHGINHQYIIQAVASFEGLPHRLEPVRIYKGVTYYNDSISTIPESTIEALRTFSGIETLLLGGFDRGIDYSRLIEYLQHNPVKNLLFIGKAGRRMFQELQNSPHSQKEGCLLFDDFEQAVVKAIELGTPGGVCLLSPSAASYDMFRNFEERGEKFRQIILGLKE